VRVVEVPEVKFFLNLHPHSHFSLPQSIGENCEYTVDKSCGKLVKEMLLVAELRLQIKKRLRLL
jgi:hypothetical protein